MQARSPPRPFDSDESSATKQGRELIQRRPRRGEREREMQKGVSRCLCLSRGGCAN